MGVPLRLVAQVDVLARKAAQGTAQFVQLEMAGAWQVGQLTASRWLWESERMHDALPQTLAMLDAATCSSTRRRCCCTAPATARRRSPGRSRRRLLPAGAALVPADLARRVDRAVLQVESEQADAAAAEQRHADAAAERHVFAKPLLDGMGLAGAVLTAEQLTAWQHGPRRARAPRAARRPRQGVERTAEQRRADLFAALPAMVLAGTAQDRAPWPATCTPRRRAAGRQTPRLPAPSAPQGCGRGRSARSSVAAQSAQRPRPGATVLDLSRAPGTLDRYGPSAPSTSGSCARTVAAGPGRHRHRRPLAVDDRRRPSRPTRTEARRQLLDRLAPDVVTDADQPQHDPSARLARLVDLRDVHCCGPGCSTTRTERDHHVPLPAGPTSAANLGRLSPRCHRAKHDGWTLVRHPDGSTTWTSPLGRTYARPCRTPRPHASTCTPTCPRRSRPRRPRPRPHPSDDPSPGKPPSSIARASAAGDPTSRILVVSRTRPRSTRRW